MDPKNEGRIDPDKEGRMEPVPEGRMDPENEGRMIPVPEDRVDLWKEGRESVLAKPPDGDLPVPDEKAAPLAREVDGVVPVVGRMEVWKDGRESLLEGNVDEELPVPDKKSGLAPREVEVAVLKERWLIGRDGWPFDGTTLVPGQKTADASVLTLLDWGAEMLRLADEDVVLDEEVRVLLLPPAGERGSADPVPEGTRSVPELLLLRAVVMVPLVVLLLAPSLLAPSLLPLAMKAQEDIAEAAESWGLSCEVRTIWPEPTTITTTAIAIPAILVARRARATSISRIAALVNSTTAATTAATIFLRASTFGVRVIAAVFSTYGLHIRP